MIEVKLREALEAHRRRTGERMTYRLLAERTGLSRSTLESIATRRTYNASLSTIDRICTALGCTPGELLEHRKPGAKAGSGPVAAGEREGPDGAY